MDIAPDDVLHALFSTIASEFVDAPYVTSEQYVKFIWFRTVIPLVCSRWRELLLHRCTAWQSVTVLPKLECAFHRKQYRSEADLPRAGSPVPGQSYAFPTVLGSSPARRDVLAFEEVAGSSPSASSPTTWMRCVVPSALSTSSTSTSTHHTTTSFHAAAAGGSNIGRITRTYVHASALGTWLARRAPSIRSLRLQLDPYTLHDIERSSLPRLLHPLKALTRLVLEGSALDQPDLGHVVGHSKQLRCLELLRASPSVTEALFPLQFLPHLTSLTLNLDIPGAYPAPLVDVPSQIKELTLGNMWLQQLPADMTALTMLTSCTLTGCTLESSPMQLLASLPALRHLHLTATHVSTAVDGLREWLVFPMTAAGGSTGGSTCGFLGSGSSSSAGGFFNDPARPPRGSSVPAVLSTEEGRPGDEAGRQVLGSSLQLQEREQRHQVLHHSPSSPATSRAARLASVSANSSSSTWAGLEGPSHQQTSSSSSGMVSPLRGQPLRCDSAPGVRSSSQGGAPPYDSSSSSSSHAGQQLPGSQTLVDFSTFDRTPGLRAVSLCNMGLQQLPPSVCHLRLLTRLVLSSNSELGASSGRSMVAGGSPRGVALGGLPVALSQLQWLQVLDLNNCGLVVLPPAVLLLPGLRELLLGGNALSGLPAAPWACEGALQSLDLAGNRMKRPPPVLSRFKALSSLSMDCSCLPGAPGSSLTEVVLGLPALTQLKLQGALWEPGAVRAVLGLQAALQRRGAPWVRLEVV